MLGTRRIHAGHEPWTTEIQAGKHKIYGYRYRYGFMVSLTVRSTFVENNRLALLAALPGQSWEKSWDHCKRPASYVSHRQ